MFILKKGDVVQFNECHKWCGCFGAIVEVKQIDKDVRYMVSVAIPEKGNAYIFVLESKKQIEFIGRAILVEKEK